jgi:hypothetical protein
MSGAAKFGSIDTNLTSTPIECKRCPGPCVFRNKVVHSCDPPFSLMSTSMYKKRENFNPGRRVDGYLLNLWGFGEMLYGMASATRWCVPRHVGCKKKYTKQWRGEGRAICDCERIMTTAMFFRPKFGVMSPQQNTPIFFRQAYNMCILGHQDWRACCRVSFSVGSWGS